MESLFSRRAASIKASEIREILKLTARPEIISFAGGLPAPELFPIEAMKVVANKVLTESGQEAMQYSTTEGFQPLRMKIAERLTRQGVPAHAENILITNGSQQGLDFSGKVFLDPDDYVLCESPSYLGAINAFMAYECKFQEIKTDDEGMVMSDLEHVLKTNDRVKMIYVIPDFQNPSGRTWSLERRKQLMVLATIYNKVIIEDNPYGELRFEGAHLPAIKSFDTDGRVVYLGTFSKTFSPGLRIGWVLASDLLLNKYIMVKQGSDLQCSSMSQRELDAFLELYSLDEHVEKIKDLYRNRRDLMIEQMDLHFPKCAKYLKPEGGLFIWVELPASVDTTKLLAKAIERHVAYVPGASFFPGGGVFNTMRMNFSNMPEPRIIEGVKRLGELLKEELANVSK